MRFLGKRLTKRKDGTYDFDPEGTKDPEYPVGWFEPEGHKNNKDTLRCITDFLSNYFYNLFDLMPKEYGTFKNADNCDIRIAMLLKDMIRIITWISNSSSMKDGELHDFDIFEIENRLTNLKLNERG